MISYLEQEARAAFPSWAFLSWPFAITMELVVGNIPSANPVVCSAADLLHLAWYGMLCDDLCV
eukprot:1271827-Amphidinium_carterae.2